MSEAAPQTVRSGGGPQAGLSPGLIAWLVAGAIAAFVAFLAAAAYQPDMAAASSKEAHALSRSPVGYAGVIRLLQAEGVSVRLSRRRDPGPALAPGALLVLTPQLTTAPAEIARMARGRRVLLVPPKWFVAPDPARRGRVMRIAPMPPEPLAQQAAALLLGPGAKPGALRLEAAPSGRAPVLLRSPEGSVAFPFTPVRLPPAEGLRSLAGAGFAPLLVDGAGRPLAAAASDGRAAFVLADPDLIANHALSDMAGARTASSLILSLADGGPVVFDLTLAGLGAAPSPLRLLFEPPFAPATACLLLAVVMLGLSARGRFGPVRRPARAYGFGKRALADSAASLLAVGGREPRLAPRYALLARDAARRACGLPPGLSEPEAEVALDRIGAARGAGGWSDLAGEAARVRTRGELMALARRVDAWRTEMTRGRG